MESRAYFVYFAHFSPQSRQQGLGTLVSVSENTLFISTSSRSTHSNNKRFSPSDRGLFSPGLSQPSLHNQMPRQQRSRGPLLVLCILAPPYRTASGKLSVLPAQHRWAAGSTGISQNTSFYSGSKPSFTRVCLTNLCFLPPIPHVLFNLLPPSLRKAKAPGTVHCILAALLRHVLWICLREFALKSITKNCRICRNIAIADQGWDG